MIELQDWAVIDKNVMDVARTGMSDPSEFGSIVVASDTIAPSAPTFSIVAAAGQLVLTIVRPTTRANGEPLNNFREFAIYHSTAAAIDISNPATYDGIIYSSSTEVPYPCTVKTYFVITALNTFSVESLPSAEDSKTPLGLDALVTNIPDGATNLVFDDAVSADGIVLGDGIIGIAFKQPGVAWVNFDRYRLEYAVNTGAGFGAWIAISNDSRTGYVHKNLSTAYAYKYRAYIVATDGTESTTPDVEDNATAGFTPNQADNSAIVAVLVLAENIIATNEIRGEHIKATSTITAGSGTDVGVLNGADATYRIYAGHSTPASAPFRVTKAGKLYCTGADIRGTLVADDITSGTMNFARISAASVSIISAMMANNSVDRPAVVNGAINVSKLYIDGGLDMAAGGGVNEVFHCSAVRADGLGGTLNANILLAATGLYLQSGTQAGNDVYIASVDDVFLDATGQVKIVSIPTSDPGEAGALWSYNSYVRISAG